MRRLLMMVAGLALVAGLVMPGCAARINSVMIDRDAGSQRWDVDNVFLAHDIKVKEVKEEVKDGVLFVHVLLKSNWGMPIGGKLKVQFYDANGYQLDDPWGWKQIMLESLQEQWFKFMAPKPADQIGRMKVMVRGINRYSTPTP